MTCKWNLELAEKSGRLSPNPIPETVNLPQTILLDAAGTLFDLAEPVPVVYARYFSSAGFLVAESKMGEAFEQVFSQRPPPDYLHHADGDQAERGWWRSVVGETARICGIELSNDEFESLFEALFQHYASGAAYTLFPETLVFLKSLRDCGYRLAVVSNFDRRLHRILSELGLSPWFAAVVGSSDACSRKPDPGIFHFALEKLGCKASEAVHIGDSAAADLAGAEAIGIRAFLLDRPRITLLEALEWIQARFVGN